MKKVFLTGWKPGFNKVGTNKLLREQGGYSLGESKNIVDAILENRQVVLVVSPETLASVSSALAQLGVIFSVESCPDADGSGESQYGCTPGTATVRAEAQPSH